MINTYEQFVMLFKCVFDHSPEGREVSELSAHRPARGVQSTPLNFTHWQLRAVWQRLNEEVRMEMPF